MLPWPLSLLAHQMRKENEMMEKEENIVVSSFACLSLTACLLMLVAHLVGFAMSSLVLSRAGGHLLWSGAWGSLQAWMVKQCLRGARLRREGMDLTWPDLRFLMFSIPE